MRTEGRNIKTINQWPSKESTNANSLDAQKHSPPDILSDDTISHTKEKETLSVRCAGRNSYLGNT
jgi:hypothetical protein